MINAEQFQPRFFHRLKVTKLVVRFHQILDRRVISNIDGGQDVNYMPVFVTDQQSAGLVWNLSLRVGKKLRKLRYGQNQRHVWILGIENRQIWICLELNRQRAADVLDTDGCRYLGGDLIDGDGSR